MKRRLGWNKLAIIVGVVGGAHAVVDATDLIITDPAYVVGTVTLGSDPVADGTVTLRTPGYTFSGVLDDSGAYGPVVVQSTAGDGTLLDYRSELSAQLQASAEILSDTHIRIRRDAAGLQAGSGLTETHDFHYDASRVKRVALTLRMAEGSPGTLDRVGISTNEIREDGERYVSYVSCCTSLGNGTERTFILPVIGSGVVTVRGTAYLRIDDGTQVSRVLAPVGIDLGAAGPHAIEWPAIDLSDVAETGSLQVSMDLAHHMSDLAAPVVTEQSIHLYGVSGTPTEGFSRTILSPSPGQGPFTIPDLVAGDYTAGLTRSAFQGGFLEHPYPAQGNRITITAGDTAGYDANVALVQVTGVIPLEGMLTPDLVSGRSIGVEPDNAATSPTRGGQAGADADAATGDFSLWLPRGPWRIRSHALAANQAAAPDRAPLAASMKTYQNFYGDAFQDLQADLDLGAPTPARALAPVIETSLVFDVEEPAGTPSIDLRCPSLSGSSSQPSKHISINAAGSCSAQPFQELRFIGEPGSYVVDARVYEAGSGSQIAFDDVLLYLNSPMAVDDDEPLVLQEHAAGPPARQRVTITPHGVVASGLVTVMQSPLGPDEPEGFRILGNGAPTYYNITASDTLQLSGDTRVCIGFRDLGNDTAEQALQMQHYENGAWVILPNQSVDVGDNLVCADTASFSPFVLTLPLPQANAGADQTLCIVAGTELALVTLDGAGSSDILGDALAYTWSQAGVELATGPSPTVSLGLGTHTIALVVRTGQAASLPDEVSVTVEVCASACDASRDLWVTCSAACPCGEGVGDCDGDHECDSGLRCLHDAGAAYGYDAEVDVCVSSCPSSGVGAWNFCTAACPCTAGQGDCDTDEHCADGLHCTNDVGVRYGLDPEVDVCE